MLPLLFSIAFAGACPSLQGQYHCILSDGNYSLLTIEQKNISQANKPEKVQYRFEYSSLSGYPDVWNASEAGESDGQGWTNRCSNARIASTPDSGSIHVEYYLNKDRAFIYSENGIEVFKCAKKSPL